MSRPITVALVQHACVEAPAANLAASGAGIREAAAAGASLVVLPELHHGPYFCQHEDEVEFARAEPVPGPTIEWLGALAAELGVVLVASVFERRAPGVYHNTAVVLERDGRLAGIYRKMHVPDDPGYQEKYYFAPGDLGFRPIPTSVGRLGVMVCWDQWFPEAARLSALAGAELLLYPTAIGWDPSADAGTRERERDAWVTVQRGHAIANTLPLLACNRIGFEPAPGGRGAGIEFWGSSFICGPQGELLAGATSDTAAVLTATVDLEDSERLRRTWTFFRDRRIDAYGGLLRRFDDG